jgi:hypothetical protein
MNMNVNLCHCNQHRYAASLDSHEHRQYNARSSTQSYIQSIIDFR